MTITKYKQMLWKTNFYAAISIKKFGFTICLDFPWKYESSYFAREAHTLDRQMAVLLHQLENVFPQPVARIDRITEIKHSSDDIERSLGFHI